MKILMRLGVVVLAVLAVMGWYRYGQEHRRADAAQSILDGQKQRADYTDNLQAATFIRADAKSITYGIPTQTTVDGQIFINIIEHTAKIDSELIVAGPDGKNDPKLLNTLKAGTPIHLLFYGNGGQDTISTVYLSP